jgi:hypothetical protein
MAEIHWKKADNGDFNDPRRWSGGVVPGAGDDAILDAAGGDSQASVTKDDTVNSIQLNANSVLYIASGATFTATEGTGAGSVANEIYVSAGATFAVGGMMDITGEIVLGGGAGKASIATLLIQSTTTLTGGGVIDLALQAGSHIKGVTTNRTLLLNDDLIEGGGAIGGGKLTFRNGGRGSVIGNSPTALIIDTGDRVIINNGSMGSQGPGGVLTIESDLENNGKIGAGGGPLTVDGAVTGKGSAEIDNDATLDLLSSFSQNVYFRDRTGTLILSQSQAYTATVSGFSSSGGSSLDLVDVGFVSATEASFSGTQAGGVLTVSDGAHTASINLKGNYLTATFAASSDGHGGTIVVANSRAPATSTHALVSAMASLGAPPAHLAHTGEAWTGRQPLLCGPRAAMA